MAVGQRLVASLTPDVLELAAGGTSRVVVAVDNRSPIVDEFRLQVEGLDATWFDIRSPKVSLFPNEADQLELDIHVPSGPVRAGTYRGVVRVVSGHDPLSVALLDITITVPLIERLEMDLRPAQVTTSGSARYRVQLNNSGNSEQVVDLRVTDGDQLLRSKLSRDRVSIPAGESVDVDVSVEPRKQRFLGLPAYHSVDIAAVRADEPLSEPIVAAVGQLVYKPRLAFLSTAARWAWGIAVVLIGLLIGLAVLAWVLGAPGERVPVDQLPQAASPVQAQQALASAAQPAATTGGALGVAAETAAAQAAAQQAAAGAAATGGGPDAAVAGQAAAAPLVPAAPAAAATPPVSSGPPPVIVNFQVKSSAAPVPGQLELVWDVQNVDQVSIGGVIFPPAGNAFVQGLQQGEVELVARNKAGVARRSVGVVVLHPPQIQEFSGPDAPLAPGQLATLSWRVDRAERVRILGPDLDPVGQLVDATRGSLQVKPTRDGAYTLVAENALGRTQEVFPVQVVTTAAVNP